MIYKPYMRVATGPWALDKGVKMIELNLLDALVKRFTDLFRAYELPSKSGALQTVKIFPQFLPQPSAVTVISKADSTNIIPQGYTATDIEGNFPCVIVKLGEVTDKEEGSLDHARANVQVVIGTFDGVYNSDSGAYEESKDCQGYRDVFNIIERIRLDLLTMPGRALDGRFMLTMPLTSGLAESEWPYFLGYMNTVWEIPRPLMPNSYE